MEIFSIIGYILIFCGCSAILIASIGMLKFKDFYSKTHVAGVNDVFGCILVLLGMIFLNGFDYFSLKIILVILVTLVASPTSTFILARYKLIKGRKDE